MLYLINMLKIINVLLKNGEFMNILGNCSFSKSRDPIPDDLYIYVSLDADDLCDDGRLIVVADNVRHTSRLISVLAESYFKPIMLVVNRRDLLTSYVEVCVQHNVEIEIRDEEHNIVTKKMSHLEKELFKLEFMLDDDKLTYVASLLVEQIGIKFTRQAAINELLDASDVITQNMATTAIDSALDRIRGRVSSIKSISYKKNVVESIDQIYEGIKKAGQGIHIVKTGMAEGKTNYVIQPLIINGMAKEEAQTLISPRRANVESSIKLEGMLHYYKDMRGAMLKEGDVKGLKVVVNSINRPNLKAVIDQSKGLYLDEGQQILKHIISGTVEKRKEIYDSLLNAIKTTDLVVLADADANDNLIEFVKQTGRNDIHIWEIQADYSRIRVDVYDYDVAVRQIMDAVANGRRVRVASDNAKMMRGLREKITSKFADKRVTCITSESIEDNDSQEFLGDPNKYITSIDVLLHSPAVSTTVSITKQHFDCTFVLGEGITGPLENVQQALRDRTITQMTVGIKNAVRRNHEVDDKVSYLRKFEGESDFELMSAKIEADEQYMKNHFVPCFIACLKQDNFNVITHIADGADELAGRKQSREIKALEYETYEQGVLNADIANASEVKSYYANGGESKSGAIERIHRTEISLLLGVTEITREDIAFFERGSLKAKVNNLAIARMSQQQILQVENSDKKNAIRDKAFYKLKNKVFNSIVRRLNLDIRTGEGSFIAEDAKAVVVWIFENKDDFHKACNIKVKAKWKESKTPIKVVTKILNSLFKLTFDSQQVRLKGADIIFRKYSINRERFAKMVRIVDNGISN